MLVNYRGGAAGIEKSSVKILFTLLKDSIILSHLYVNLKINTCLGINELCHYTTCNGCLSNPFLNDNFKTRSLLGIAVEKLTTMTYKKSQCE